MTSSRLATFALALSCFVAVAACSSGTTPTDAGGLGDDASTGGGDTGTTDAGTDAASADDAASTDDAGTDAASTDDAGSCPAPIDDLSGIGATCSNDGDCPTGYSCRAFSGIVLTHSCQILCDPSGCPCPDTTSCTAHSDKGTSWSQCDPV